MNNVFDSLESAPPPSDELRDIYIDQDDGWLIHYIARDGRWIATGRVYPAVAD